MVVTRSQTKHEHQEAKHTVSYGSTPQMHNFNTLPSRSSSKRRKWKTGVKTNKLMRLYTKDKDEEEEKKNNEESITLYILNNAFKFFWEDQRFKIIEGLMKILIRHNRKWAAVLTLILTFFLCYRRNVFDIGNIGHTSPLKELQFKLSHKPFERTSDVKFLMDELDRLRFQNPKQEVHVVISGGPGSGKSELARQFGQQIYDRDNNCYQNFTGIFSFCLAFRPVDVVTLNAESLSDLQYSLEDVLGKCKGQAANEIIHSSAQDEEVLKKFGELKETFRNRSSRPVIIFDNVKGPMYTFLYKKRGYGRFLLYPGNDKHGEIRIVVTTQNRPSTKFPTFISYMDLSKGLPLHDSVNLLNTITEIQNDNKNASYLVEELGGLPLSLANAALYIQSAKELNGEFSYYHYLKEFKLDLDKYRHHVERIWKDGVDYGLTYNMTAAATSIKTIEQLINTSDHLFYKEVACFIGYCDSPTISGKLLWKYITINPSLRGYTEFDVNMLIQKSSIYNFKLSQKQSLVSTHQVTREASRVVCNLKVNNTNDSPEQYHVEDSLARISDVILTEMLSKTEFNSSVQMVEYTSLKFRVADVLMSLITNSFKRKLNVSRLFTKEFCWAFLNSMSEAYLYWPNKHKSTVIMPDVAFLVNMTEESFSEQNPELAVLLSVLYLYYTGNQRPKDLDRIVTMVENFTRRSSANVDVTSFEKTALLLNMMGTVYRDAGQNMSKAQELHELALHISKNFNSSSEIVVSLHLVGVISRYRKQLDQARKYHEAAVERGRTLYSNTNPRLGAFLLNLAVVYNRVGEFKKATEVYLEALNVTRNAYGTRDQRVARVLNTLATNYNSLGQYDDSIKVLLQALSIHEEIHGEIHPNVGETLYFLGFTYRAKGDLESSLQVLQRSMEIRLQYYGTEHYHVAEVLHELSNTQRELHRLEVALHNAKNCLNIFNKSLGESSSELAVSLNGLGLIYLELGDARMAKTKHDKALKIFEDLNTQGSQTVSICETLKNIGMALRDMNETKKAREYYSRSLSMLQTVYKGHHPRVKEIHKLLKVLE